MVSYLPSLRTQKGRIWKKIKMKLWLISEENIHIVGLIFQIETAKADLQRMQFQLDKFLDKNGALDIGIEMIENNMSYLKEEAKIVSMGEYKKISYQLTGLYQERIEVINNIKLCKKEILNIENKIKELEEKKKQVTFKILEFKRK